MTFNPVNTQNTFLPTTIFFPDNFDEFRVKFIESYILSANAINSRDIGIYDEQEIITGQVWATTDVLTKGSTFRKIFFFGAIAPGATLNIPHGLGSTISLVTEWKGGVVVAGGFRPLPRVSATAVNEQISVDISGANIVIVNGAGAPAITNGVVVLEYIKV